MGGFARAGNVPPALYEKASPDPVAGACAAVIERWNARADGSLVAIVRTLIGDVGVTQAAIASVDCLGLNLATVRAGGNYKLRLPFMREATTVEAVEAQLKEMEALSAAGRS